MDDASPAARTRTAAPRFGEEFLRDLWWFAATGDALKRGELQRFELLGEPVLLGRDLTGEVYALRDVCPHRAAPLSAGRLVGETVECPYHGWRFGLRDGVCAAIPSLVGSEGVEPSRMRVRRYPARESQGLVFVFMGADPRVSEEPADEPPMFPGAVGGRPKIVESMTFRVHVDHAAVGLMDPAHGPYVHAQWWWRSSHKLLEKAKAFEPRPLGFAMARHAPSKNSRAYRILGGAPRTEITFALPGYRWEHVTVGERQVLALTCLTPVTATTTRITQVMWSDHWAFSVLQPFIRAGARRFLEQDGAMVNLQNQGLRYDPALIWIDDSDRQAKWYQALKREWIVSRAEGRAFVNPVEATTLRWRS